MLVTLWCCRVLLSLLSSCRYTTFYSVLCLMFASVVLYPVAGVLPQDAYRGRSRRFGGRHREHGAAG